MYPLDEEGQGLVEYALIIAFIALAIILALTTFGGALASYYDSIGSSIRLVSPP